MRVIQVDIDSPWNWQVGVLIVFVYPKRALAGRSGSVATATEILPEIWFPKHQRIIEGDFKCIQA
jgi:hypothetical protein